MKQMGRFKIDIYDSHSFPFGLYVNRPSFFKSARWFHLEHFETREKAKEYYEKIKDLPEYLP